MRSGWLLKSGLLIPRDEEKMLRICFNDQSFFRDKDFKHMPHWLTCKINIAEDTLNSVFFSAQGISVQQTHLVISFEKVWIVVRTNFSQNLCDLK